MILSMSGQALYFLRTVLMGAGAGLAYDVFRILRKTFKHPDVLTQIEDLVYWILVAVFLFYFILHTNSGEVRVYAIVGVFTGMILYFAAVSRFVMKIALAVLGFLQKILLTALQILLYPFRLLYRLLRAAGRRLKKIILGWLEPGKKFLQNTGRYVKMKARKVKRDLRIIQKNV